MNNIQIIEKAVDKLFESIYNKETEKYIKIVDGKYIITVDCGNAPIVSGQNKIIKEDN